MKCINCKLVKFDGKQYTCPAHPYAENIDLYTEHESCAAPVWYPNYLKDRITSLAEGLSTLGLCLKSLHATVNEFSHYGGYGKQMYGDLKDLHNKYDTLYNKMMEELKLSTHELERISNEKSKEDL